MIIPGVKYVGWCVPGAVPADAELQVMAGLPLNIAGIAFTGLMVVGDPKLELSDDNEHNGSNQKALLSFVTLSEFSVKRCAFIVQTVSGSKFLIGSRDSVPSVSIKDTFDAPGSAHGKQVTVELSSPVAWMKVIGQESIITEQGYVTFEDWRTIADATYSQLGHRHGSDEVDDAPSEQTQEQNNIAQAKKIKKAIKLAKAAL